MKEEIKRLFFAVQVHAPWPVKLPHGRMLDAAHRHMTLAFLGNQPYAPLREHLPSFPTPPMQIGRVGWFDSCLALPERHPNVVSWHAAWLGDNLALASFQKKLIAWLLECGYDMDTREWLPHVTLCRQPFDLRAWKQTFVPLPFYTGSFHLYESPGNLIYNPVWSYPIRVPFEEIDHTADITFSIYGETLQQLYHNAFTALAFKFPPLLDFFASHLSLETVDDLIIGLNDIIGHADREIGCPFKAVSFHGQVANLEDLTLQWEMIVDV